jgi:hypothetical protein
MDRNALDPGGEEPPSKFLDPVGHLRRQAELPFWGETRWGWPGGYGFLPARESVVAETFPLHALLMALRSRGGAMKADAIAHEALAGTQPAITGGNPRGDLLAGSLPQDVWKSSSGLSVRRGMTPAGIPPQRTIFAETIGLPAPPRQPPDAANANALIRDFHLIPGGRKD